MHRRTAGNTNDLRGKILRIRLTEDGYEIPEGNLFPEGTAKTRPEIYVMGCRNPFRISLDPKTSDLYWGEVGPDAGKEGKFGPRGHDEVNRAVEAGNFGWPFLVADNLPYHGRDFATGEAKDVFEASAPMNLGERNTGLEQLPPAMPALIYYSYKESEELPVLGDGGRNAMAGPIFYYEAKRKYNIMGRNADRTLLTYDWMRGKIFKAKLGAKGNLENLEILVSKLVHPMDLEMDSEGSLVLLEYGSDWYFNKDGSVSRFRPDDGNQAPSISIKEVKKTARTFAVDEAKDPEGGKLVVRWYVTEGVREKELGTGSEVTLPDGNFQEIRAVATDEKGARTVARIKLDAADELPSLALDLSGYEGKLDFGDKISFEVKGAEELDAKLLTVRARYISPEGHDAGGPQFSTDVTTLAKTNQCFACHQIAVQSVGPSYLDVSLKYRGEAGADNYLLEKLKNGGGGVWGEVPMPPQIALKDENADILVRAILGLSNGMSEVKAAKEGSLTLAPKFDVPSGGTWEISASAPGYSPSKARLPAK